MAKRKNDGRKLLRTTGACSHTAFKMLNRGFGEARPREERGTDPLAGGILEQGYQCGMVWGSAMGVGAEAYRRTDNPSEATATAVNATQAMMLEFEAMHGSTECMDITEMNLQSKLNIWKFLLSGKFLRCFRMAEEWGEKALQTAGDGIFVMPEVPVEQAVSCASEVAKRMGANEEQQAMAAGLAGGIGLSGGACGALGAAIWMNTMRWCDDNPGKYANRNPEADATMKAFYEATGHEILCRELIGRQFGTLEEHSNHIRDGGCKELMDALVATRKQETKHVENQA
ncbi:hypothetical protein GF324_11035 [bacterium]|nr:hypothetical protein [bacterium]